MNNKIKIIIINAAQADFERKISRIATRNPEGGRVAFSLASFCFAVFAEVSFLSAISSLLPIEF